jgi:serine protease Do
MARRAYFALSALLLVLVCTTLASTQRAETPRPQATAPAAPMASSATSAPRTATTQTDFRRLFIDVAKNVRPSVVAVTSVSTVEGPAMEEGNPFEWFFRGNPQQQRGGKQKRQGMGSGVIISRDGLVLTNNHVVADADELTVVLQDDRELDAELVGADPKSDIAVIRIKDKAAAAQLTPAQLGDSAKLEVGEWVMAIGSPFGLKQTVSAGIVSAIGRGNVGIVDYEDFVQTDAAINPGNSGGPLVNLDGRVVGINTAIASRTGGNNGVGFAIPVNMARAVMDQLVDHGNVVRGYIGVFIGNLDPELAKSFGYQGKAGVLVQDVAQEGPGAKAGLIAGDIVMERDGKAVTDVAAFRNGIAAARPGTKVSLAVWRGGKRTNLGVTLGELPDDSKGPARKAGGRAPGSSSESENKIGLRLDDISPALRERFSLGNTKGALIVGVAQGSPADEAGLRPGDVITQIGNDPVASAADAQRVVQSSDGKASLRLRVEREGRGSFTLVRPGK